MNKRRKKKVKQSIEQEEERYDDAIKEQKLIHRQNIEQIKEEYNVKKVEELTQKSVDLYEKALERREDFRDTLYSVISRITDEEVMIPKNNVSGDKSGVTVRDGSVYKYKSSSKANSRTVLYEDSVLNAIIKSINDDETRSIFIDHIERIKKNGIYRLDNYLFESTSRTFKDSHEGKLIYYEKDNYLYTQYLGREYISIFRKKDEISCEDLVEKIINNNRSYRYKNGRYRVGRIPKSDIANVAIYTDEFIALLNKSINYIQALLEVEEKIYNDFYDDFKSIVVRESLIDSVGE